MTVTVLSRLTISALRLSSGIYHQTVQTSSGATVVLPLNNIFIMALMSMCGGVTVTSGDLGAVQSLNT